MFVSERDSPFTTGGFARMLERTAAVAGLGIKAHPLMLGHGCGYALANEGHDTRAIQGWLGHRSITSTAIYTALAPGRFKDFWRE
jgi:site-specific recombinase XerD